MAPDSDGTRTVACRLEKWLPDAGMVMDVRTAVLRVHEATIHATHLLNLHIRRCIESNVAFDRIFDHNWILNVFYEVTSSSTSPASDPELSKTAAECMPSFNKPPRNGINHVMHYNARRRARVQSPSIVLRLRRGVNRGL